MNETLHILMPVLNGMLFLPHHYRIFKKLTIPWQWHIVEGLAAPENCTSWCAWPSDKWHKNYLSADGTTEYLDEIVQDKRIRVYRPKDKYWHGKIQMVNAPLVASIPPHSVLHEMATDEFWSVQQLTEIYERFMTGDVGEAWYHAICYAGPNVRYSGLVPPPGKTWQFNRTFHYAGYPHITHEPISIPFDGKILTHEYTKDRNWILYHFHLVSQEQVDFKEEYHVKYQGEFKRWWAMANSEGLDTDPGIMKYLQNEGHVLKRTEHFMDVINRLA